MEIAVSAKKCGAAREVWELHHLTDLHYDDPDFAASEMEARVKRIADNPRALWMGGGDYGSLILPGDPRFATGDGIVHRLPDKYVEDVTEMLHPIRDKCIGFGTGNHEWTIGKHYHRGVGAEVAANLGIPRLYLGARGWAVVQFAYTTRKLTLRVFQYHGWSAGRLKGRKALQAERDLGAWDADVFTLGHDHQPYDDIWYTESAVCDRAGWRLRQRPRAFLNGGSATYGQRAPDPKKTFKKASEWPNEMWVEGKNFRPQPPVWPHLDMHLDFGAGADSEHKRRPATIAFETRMFAPVFER